MIICYAKCEPCQFGDHFDPPEPHPWAGIDDIEHAANTGQEEPTGNCGCWCAVVAKQAPTREELIAKATKIHNDEGCGCDPKYLMSCPKFATAILRTPTEENL